jgi:hypothetical protein
MARSMLMMFMQLGQTQTGSRALGETFVDWFSLQQEMIAEWAMDIADEEIIGDWWRWNVDPDTEQTPMLAYKKLDDGQAALGDFGGADLPPEVNKDKSQGKPNPSAPNSESGSVEAKT